MLHFIIFHSELCKIGAVRALAYQTIGTILKSTSLGMAFLFGFEITGQKKHPTILSVCQTIHQVKANSQKEWVSAQKRVSTKRLIIAFQLEKQTEEPSDCQKRPLKL